MTWESIKQSLSGYFNLTPYLEHQEEAKAGISAGVSFRGPNIIILIIAVFVASLGLNTNSTAVIIGAMLISPLMGPIVGIGLGAGTYDFPLIRRSARNLAAAAIFSVITATIYFLISPVSQNHSELLARTSPTIYDVLIAFFGGSAGIVAIACNQKGSNVVPGVAIATALMPPLCTVGYGLATWQLNYAYGALYLFLINSIFIALSTLIGVKLFKFQPVTFVDAARKQRVKHCITYVVIATLLPSVYLTVMMLRDSFYINDANNFVQEEFNFPNTQVFASKAYVKHWKKYLDVTLIGQAVNIDSLQTALVGKLNDKRSLRNTHLKITQGFSTGSVARESTTGNLSDVFSSVVNQIERQKNTIDSLRNVIVARENFDSLSYVIAPEIKVLFPQVSYISIGHEYVCNTENRQIDTVNVALVRYGKPTPDLTKMAEYLETRTGLPDVHIIHSEYAEKAKK